MFDTNLRNNEDLYLQKQKRIVASKADEEAMSMLMSMKDEATLKKEEEDRALAEQSRIEQLDTVKPEERVEQFLPEEVKPQAQSAQPEFDPTQDTLSDPSLFPTIPTKEAASGLESAVKKIPTQTAGGVLQSAQNTYNSYKNLADYVNSQGLDLQLPSPDKLATFAEDMIPREESAGYNLYREFVSFVAPYGAISRLTKAGNVGKAAISSFISLTQDPRHDNAANMTQQWLEKNYGQSDLANLIGDYLGTNQNDPMAKNMFKNAVLDLFMSGLVETAFIAPQVAANATVKTAEAFKKLREYKKAVRSAENPPAIPVDAPMPFEQGTIGGKAVETPRPPLEQEVVDYAPQPHQVEVSVPDAPAGVVSAEDAYYATRMNDKEVQNTLAVVASHQGTTIEELMVSNPKLVKAAIDRVDEEIGNSALYGRDLEYEDASIVEQDELQRIGNTYSKVTERNLVEEADEFVPEQSASDFDLSEADEYVDDYVDIPEPTMAPTEVKQPKESTILVKSDSLGSKIGFSDFEYDYDSDQITVRLNELVLGDDTPMYVNETRELLNEASSALVREINAYADTSAGFPRVKVLINANEFNEGTEQIIHEIVGSLPNAKPVKIVSKKYVEQAPLISFIPVDVLPKIPTDLQVIEEASTLLKQYNSIDNSTADAVNKNSWGKHKMGFPALVKVHPDKARELYEKIVPNELKSILSDKSHLAELSAKSPVKMTAEEAIDSMDNLVGLSAGDRVLNVNLTKINESEDLRKVFASIVYNNMEAQEIARRGYVSNKGALQKASELNANRALRAIMERRPGQLLPQDIMIWGGQAAASAVSNLMDLLHSYKMGKLPAEDVLKAYKAAQLLISSVYGSASESARILQTMKQFRQSSRGYKEFLNSSQVTADNVGDLASKLTALSNTDATKAILKSGKTNLPEAIVEASINGMLSHPASHIGNMVANAMFASVEFAEVAFARLFASMSGSKAYSGEMAATWKGWTSGYEKPGEEIASMFNGYYEALTHAKAVFKHEKTFDPKTKGFIYSTGKITKALLPSNLQDTFLGRALDITGATVRSPGRAMGAEDEFAKVFHYRASIARSIEREARSLELTGNSKKEFMAESFRNPTEEMKKEAIGHMRTMTFTKDINDTFAWMQKMQEAKVLNWPVGRLVFPFLKTSFNIIEASMERLPLTMPFMEGTRNMWKSGPAGKQMVLARATTGSLFLGTGAMLFGTGQMTGMQPGDPEAAKIWRDAGYVENSILVGDEYYPIEKLGPVGALLIVGAHASQIMSMADDNEKFQDILGALALLSGNFFTPDILMNDMESVLSAIRSGDKKAIEQFMARQAIKTVPFSALSRGIRKVVDPEKRVVKGDATAEGFMKVVDPIIRQMMNVIPGLSSSLQSYRNLLGEKVVLPGGMIANMVSPFIGTTKSDSVVMKELNELGFHSPIDPKAKTNEITFSISEVPASITVINIAGKSIVRPLTPEQHDGYKVLAAGYGWVGRDGKPFLRNGEPVPTLAEELGRMIKSGYADEKAIFRVKEMTPELKKLAIKNKVKAYRQMAEQQAIMKYNLAAPSVKDGKDFLQNVTGGRENRTQDFRMDIK